MNGRVLVLALWPWAAAAQGFAGLGTEVEGFALPDPHWVPDWSVDHGPHTDFRVEWWYLTATLETADGEPLGTQWTLFRTALAPGRDLWMGHAALTDADAHRVAERLSGGEAAGVTADPFAAWIDEWAMAGDPAAAMTLTSQGTDWAVDLSLTATGPLVLQGDRGYSVKSPGGQASHYYSQPFLAVTGTVTRGGATEAVTGQAWLDREWSSQPLAADQEGWDWISLAFDGGAKLMGFRLRDSGDGFTSATWIEPDGTPMPYGDGALVLTPGATAEVAGREVPVEWRVELPAEGVDVTIDALNPQAWMGTTVPYWEGPVSIEGSHRGRGYLEMTGY